MYVCTGRPTSIMCAQRGLEATLTSAFCEFKDGNNRSEMLINNTSASPKRSREGERGRHGVIYG